jgi:prolyl-tRNA synthetase
MVADIVSAQAGDACPQCGAHLRLERGVELGNTFKLGVRYSEAMNCTYLDEAGQAQPVVMGSYGIGIGRLLACIAETYHDEYGLIWPPAVAPFQVHLILLKGKGAPEAEDLAEKVYADLKNEGLEVLYDNRAESPGVKFNTADLIGIPLRLTVSERALKAGGVEFKRRDLDQKEILSMEGLARRLRSELEECQAALEAKAVSVVKEGF